MQIMLVDDDSAVRELLTYHLTALGHVVFSVQDGEDAWCLYQYCAEHNTTPDLVITDYCMPNLDGAGLIVRIREVRPSQAIILMSATPAKFEMEHPELDTVTVVEKSCKSIDVAEMLRRFHAKSVA